MSQSALSSAPLPAGEVLGFSRDSAGRARLSGRPLSELLEEAGVATPAYFYDLSGIEARLRSLDAAFGDAPHLIAYAVKANSAGSIVETVKRVGAGIDAVSGGELLLARRIGIDARKIVLSGVAKRNDELSLAILEDILALQAESVGELSRIADEARRLGRRARVSVRINPSVTIDSHEKISTGHDAAKFGVSRRDFDEVFSTLAARNEDLSLVGLSTHVGSMLKSPEGYVDSARVVCELAKTALELGHRLEYVDFGGGFGIDYGGTAVDEPALFARAAVETLRDAGLGSLTLVVEPGRSIVGPFGVLLASTIQHKASGERRWLMIDAGMNDLVRPAMYGARHRIEPLDSPAGEQTHQVVGPVCESSDDFGVFALGEPPARVVIRDAGAYGFSMASEYNARPLPAEVFVREGRVVKVSPSPGLEAWLARRLGA